MNEGRVAFPEDLSDTNGADNRVDLNATVGTSAGVNTTWGGWATASYSLVSDNSNGGFKIDSKTGAVTVADASKFTASITYEITVRAQVDGNTIDQDFIIPVGDGTAPVPIFTSPATASTNENTTAVMTVAAPDGEGHAITYSIVGGADAALFTINSSTGALSFIGAPNFEAPTDVGANNVYDVHVQADNGLPGGIAVQIIAVTVNDVNDVAPAITSGTTANVAENTTAVLNLTATDLDTVGGPVTFAIVGGADAARFTIVGNQLQFNPAPNFEAPADAGANNVYNVQVQASDGVNSSAVQSIAVTVTDVNDVAPSFTSGATVNVAENTTTVLSASATDPDTVGTITFSIVGGADAGKFTIVGNQLQFVAGPNFEAPTDGGINNVYDVQVQASDGVNTTTQSVAVTVTDVDEFDVGLINDTNVALDTVAENAAIGTAVGITAFASDADGSNNTVTYSLDATAGGRFAISAGGVVTVAGALDFEAAQSHTITVRATSTDGSFSTRDFVIPVTGVSDTAPVAQDDSAGIAEDVDTDPALGVQSAVSGNLLANDDDGDLGVTDDLDVTAVSGPGALIDTATTLPTRTARW